MSEDEELQQPRQESQALQEINQALRAGVLEARRTIEARRKQVKELQGVSPRNKTASKPWKAGLPKIGGHQF